MRKTLLAITAVLAILLTGCTSGLGYDETHAVLTDHWDQVGGPGRVGICQGLELNGQDWLVEQVEHYADDLDADAIRDFYADACAGRTT